MYTGANREAPLPRRAANGEGSLGQTPSLGDHIVAVALADNSNRLLPEPPSRVNLTVAEDNGDQSFTSCREAASVVDGPPGLLSELVDSRQPARYTNSTS